MEGDTGGDPTRLCQEGLRTDSVSTDMKPGCSTIGTVYLVRVLALSLSPFHSRDGLTLELFPESLGREAGSCGRKGSEQRGAD